MNELIQYLTGWKNWAGRWGRPLPQPEVPGPSKDEIARKRAADAAAFEARRRMIAEEEARRNPVLQYPPGRSMRPTPGGLYGGR